LLVCLGLTILSAILSSWYYRKPVKTQEKSTGNADNSELLNILKSIQDNQKKQGDKLNSLTGKVNELYDYDEEHDEYDDNEDHYEPF
jgi:hypothetical protein